MLWPFIVLLVVTITPEVHGYGTGAPSSTCRDMMPHHGMNRPITSQAPYTITISKQTYQPGETIVVTLQGISQTTFKGYLFQARPITATGRATFVGAFSVPRGSKNMACGFGGFEGVTHTERSDKQRVSFHWTAPTTPTGNVVIVATIVHSYSNYWLGITSPVLSPETVISVPPTTQTAASVIPTRPSTRVILPQQPTQRNNVFALRPVWTKRPITTSTTQQPTFVPTVQWGSGDHSDSGSQSATGSKFLSPDPECGKTKGCYLKCNKQRCKFIVTWQSRGDTVHFQLASLVATQGDSWIAIGLSDDTKMGTDSVTECISESGSVQVFQSYNNGYTNKKLQNAKTGITGESGSIVDGIMRCQFNRATIIPGIQQIFDLNRDWYLMFANGAANIGFNKAMHGTSKDTMPMASSLRIDYQNFQVVDTAASYPLVKVHACFMLLAWVFFTGIGIITARYYKSVWQYSTLMGLRIWFQIHRACMVAAFALTIIAFIIIFVEAQGYSQIANIPGQGYLRAHPVLGIIVTILVVINPIMSLFRPAPTTSRRPIFNWAHWGVGMLAHLLAVLTICFGIQLGKSSTPDLAVYVMVACVLYQVLFGVTLETLKLMEKRKIETAKIEALEMKSSVSTGSMSNGASHTADTAITLTESPIRKFLLLIHVIAMFGFTLALILLVALN